MMDDEFDAEKDIQKTRIMAMTRKSDLKLETTVYRTGKQLKYLLNTTRL